MSGLGFRLRGSGFLGVGRRLQGGKVDASGAEVNGLLCFISADWLASLAGFGAMGVSS